MIVPKAADFWLTILFLGSVLPALFLTLKPKSGGNGQTIGSTLQRLHSISLATTLLLGAVLVLLNNHRVQPWHWLFILVVVSNFLPGDSVLKCCRVAIAMIYIFAGLSRLGPSVDSGVSLQIVTQIMDSLSLAHVLRNEDFVFGCCLAMSVVETATGVLLLVRRTRRYAVAMSIGIHLLLLLTLGPWGLNHQAAVLIWNAYFAFAIPTLFLSSDSQDRNKNSLTPTKPARSRSVACLTIFLVLFPLSGLFGIADNWPAWQLYSPRPEVIRVFVSQKAVNSLPPNLQKFVGTPAPLDDWCPIRIDRWSLAATGSPIYPEDRFQLAIARSVMNSAGEENTRVEFSSPETLLWWRRRRIRINSLAELVQKASEYSLNSTTIRR